MIVAISADLKIRSLQFAFVQKKDGVLNSYKALSTAGNAPPPNRAPFLRVNFLSDVVRSIVSQFISDQAQLDVVTKVTVIVGWIYVILSILGTFGFHTTPLLSLLSIAAATFGASLQNLLRNMYAGLLMLFLKPFHVGSVITVEGLTGKFISINISYIKLYDAKEKTDIMIPTSFAYKSAIIIHNSAK